MAPLVLHNVAEDELFTGNDGVQRPYGVFRYASSAMPPDIPDLPDFSQSKDEGNPSVLKPRRAVAETGSFGKSTRRSRSRTGTPAAKREDPTLAAADAIFSQFFAQKAAEKPESQQRKQSVSSISQPNLSSAAPLGQIDGNAGPSSRYAKKEPPKEPTEVILRGFKSNQQYAAIREYERIGGRICEDYPRDPPIEQRRYKSDLRDPASMRRKPLTAEEKAKAYKFAGGEHWIKVTFESAEAAEVAVEASPQTILGHIISAELYRGIPPTADAANPVDGKQSGGRGDRLTSQSLGAASGSEARGAARSSTLPRSYNTPMREIGRGANSLSPPDSTNSSSHTLDTATLSHASGTASSATVTGFAPGLAQDSPTFCERIPTAKRMKLLPAEQALLPQQSFTKRFMSQIPLVSWLSADIIGSAVPRTEQGEFDWEKASLYWKMVWWVDSVTGWFDVCGTDKEE